MKALLGLVILAGCAQAPPVSEAALEVANRPLYCEGRDQCDRYWKRAQLWIAQNSRWRIQTATDVMIQTFGPTQASTNRAYRVLREPESSRERIRISTACGNWFGCEEPEAVAVARFKAFVAQ